MTNALDRTARTPRAIRLVAAVLRSLLILLVVSFVVATFTHTDERIRIADNTAGAVSYLIVATEVTARGASSERRPS